jgi:hypothetical protein
MAINSKTNQTTLSTLFMTSLIVKCFIMDGALATRARKLGWNVHTMAVVHDVMITHPNKLVKMLLQITKK